MNEDVPHYCFFVFVCARIFPLFIISGIISINIKPEIPKF